MDDPSTKPLQGFRILSIEQFGAAPYGSMYLADLGAQVIKIENVSGGDAARHTGPHMLGDSDSLYFQTWHSNKQSVTLDLKDAAGRRALERLAADADALIDNLRGDLPEKLGLDYPTLSALNPRLVCLHISAYGRDNPRASRPGYDFLMQAEAGLMSLTGDPRIAPARMGPSIIDYMTGMTGIVGLLSCLLRARQTGRGCDVDTCLFDVALHQLGYAGTWFLNTGYAASRLPRSAHFAIGPVQTFPSSDGWVFVMCMTQKFWEVLLAALGRNDLGDDPRFASPVSRGRHRDELGLILDCEFRKRSTVDWVELLGDELPIAPVLDVQQALTSPFVAETGMVNSVPHPLQQDLRLLSNPLKIDGRRPSQRSGAALGASNISVLGGDKA